MNRRLAAALAMLWAAPVAGQATEATPTRLQVRGDVGTEGEMYRMDGLDARRPNESGRLFFNPTLSFGTLSVSGNFLLSSEASSGIGLGGLPGRQRVNQFGVTPRWDWGRLDLGSFADAWTPLTWAGVRVDGAGFNLTPGLLRVGAFTGRTRQPVFGGATSGSYRRSIVGARLGAGRKAEYGPSGPFIDVVFLHVADDPASLPVLPDSTPVPYLPDSLAIQPDTALLPHVPINPYAVTPQENAVVSTAVGTSILDGAVAWNGELAASLHSRDRRASRLTDEQAEEIPGLLRDLFAPRVGTHADIAWRSQLDVRVARLPGATPQSPRSVSLSLGMQSIGAGYVSLGTPWLPNDARGLDGRATVRIDRVTLQLDGLRQHDNLAGQKLATTDRSRFGVAVIARPVREWQATFRATTVGMQRALDDSLGGIDYAARMINTTHAWIPQAAGRIRSISASYTWQYTGDDNPRRGADLVSHTTDLRIAFPLGAMASITPSLGVTRSTVGAAPGMTRATWGISADWRDPQRRWSTNGSLHRTQIGRTLAVTSRLQVRFTVTPDDVLTVMARGSRYRSLVDASRNFDERALVVRWGRRFGW